MASIPTIPKVVEESPDLSVDPVQSVQVEIPYQQSDFFPCNWSLKSEGGDLISGVNLSTGRHFSGTMLEFNNFMKGA